MADVNIGQENRAPSPGPPPGNQWARADHLITPHQQRNGPNQYGRWKKKGRGQLVTNCAHAAGLLLNSVRERCGPSHWRNDSLNSHLLGGWGGGEEEGVFFAGSLVSFKHFAMFILSWYVWPFCFVCGSWECKTH